VLNNSRGEPGQFSYPWMRLPWTDLLLRRGAEQQSRRACADSQRRVPA
jgi:hypothetical protein